MDEVAKFDEEKLRWFLAKRNFSWASHPQVVTMVERGLELDPAIPFGSVPLHDDLTSEQLAALLNQAPRVRESVPFAIAYLKKLRPGAETDFDQDVVAHAAHLQRCRDYVVDLPCRRPARALPAILTCVGNWKPRSRISKRRSRPSRRSSMNCGSGLAASSGFTPKPCAAVIWPLAFHVQGVATSVPSSAMKSD